MHRSGFLKKKKTYIVSKQTRKHSVYKIEMKIHKKCMYMPAVLLAYFD